jgi:hypothetical protein
MAGADADDLADPGERWPEARPAGYDREAFETAAAQVPEGPGREACGTDILHRSWRSRSRPASSMAAGFSAPGRP